MALAWEAARGTPEGSLGGMNMMSIFTRTPQPEMAAHVLRAFWVKGTDTAPNSNKEKRGDA